MKTIHDKRYRILVDCLREARDAAKVTQVELAKRLGTDQSYVSKYERYERRLDIIELREISVALGSTLVEFVSRFEAKLRDKERGR